MSGKLTKFKDRFSVKQESQGIPDPDQLIKIKSIQTVGSREDETIEKWKIEVYSVNDIAAKQRARGYIRRKVPNSMNILNPEITGRETEQSTLVDFFTNSIDLEFRTVEMTIVKPIGSQ